MYFVAKMAAKSLTKQIHTEAQKSKLESWTCLEETLKKRDCIHGPTWVGRSCCRHRQRSRLGILEGSSSPQPAGSPGSGCRRWTGSRRPWKKGFFLDDVIKAFEPSQKEPARGANSEQVFLGVISTHLRLKKFLHEPWTSPARGTSGWSSVSRSTGLFC